MGRHAAGSAVDPDAKADARLTGAPMRAWRALGDPEFRRAYPAWALALCTILLVEAASLTVAAALAPALGVVAVLTLSIAALALR